MEAELRHPRALIGDRPDPGWLRADIDVLGHRGSIRSRLEVRIDHVETDVCLAVNVELRPGTNDPVLPVVVATIGNRSYPVRDGVLSGAQ